jgi:G3E family GTPase
MTTPDADAAAPPLPVTIITGFLGSGKTTLLNHILTNQQGLRTAVLVNEFGDIGIDGALIVAAGDDMMELSNGCICCSMNGDLMDAIYRVLERPERVDYLVVETTGLADPLPVARTFLGPEFRDATRLDSILTVADAENFSLDRFDGPAPRSQLMHADIVLLNKCDLVGEGRLSEVESRIRSIKAEARILRSVRSQVPLPLILSVGLFESDRIAEGGCNHDHGHDHIAADGFTSVSFESDRPLSLARFQQFLDRLPGSVFRAKGILSLDASAKRYVFHLTGRRFSLEEGAWTGPRSNRLVLIGQRLDGEFLREQLGSCLAE